MDSLDKRREKLCLNFAKKCIKNEKQKQLFPRRKQTQKRRKKKTNEIFKIKKIKTARYKKSAIPYMTNLLNSEYEKKNQEIEYKLDVSKQSML